MAFDLAEEIGQSLTPKEAYKLLLKGNVDGQLKAVALGKLNISRQWTLIEAGLYHEELASSGDMYVRSKIAKTTTIPELLVRLSNDIDDGVKINVVHNPCTPLETLLKLERDPNTIVAQDATIRRCERNVIQP